MKRIDEKIKKEKTKTTNEIKKIIRMELFVIREIYYKNSIRKSRL